MATYGMAKIVWTALQQLIKIAEFYTTDKAVYEDEHAVGCNYCGGRAVAYRPITIEHRSDCRVLADRRTITDAKKWRDMT